MHPQIEFLLNHAATASSFTSTAGQAFVSLPLGPFSHQVCSVLSPRFRDWLIDAFYREHQEPPTNYALRQTIRTLHAHAICSGARLPVHRRVAARGNPRQPDAILLDLANSDGEIVEITPDGWHITTDSSAAFLHSRGNAELPRPASQSSPITARLLPPALNFATDADRTRLTAWLLSALRPIGPHPILVLDGPPSSGKSTAARMLRALIDPASAPLHSLPASETELLALAQHNWILAFDHAGPIRPRTSGALCGLATGTAFLQREKADDREPVPLELYRPVLITTSAGGILTKLWPREPSQSALSRSRPPPAAPKPICGPNSIPSAPQFSPPSATLQALRSPAAPLHACTQLRATPTPLTGPLRLSPMTPHPSSTL